MGACSAFTLTKRSCFAFAGCWTAHDGGRLRRNVAGIWRRHQNGRNKERFWQLRGHPSNVVRRAGNHEIDGRNVQITWCCCEWIDKRNVANMRRSWMKSFVHFSRGRVVVHHCHGRVQSKVFHSKKVEIIAQQICARQQARRFGHLIKIFSSSEIEGQCSVKSGKGWTLCSLQLSHFPIKMLLITTCRLHMYFTSDKRSECWVLSLTKVASYLQIYINVFKEISLFANRLANFVSNVSRVAPAKDNEGRFSIKCVYFENNTKTTQILRSNAKRIFESLLAQEDLKTMIRDSVRHRALICENLGTVGLNPPNPVPKERTI